MPAERELGVDPLLERDDPQLVEPRRLEPGELLLVEVGERRAAPERERLAQQRRAPCRLGAARFGEQALEAVRVDALGLERQPVAGRPA